MRKTLSPRKLAIYGGMLLGFVMLESPMIMIVNKIDPMIMGAPFLFVWNLGWWAFLTGLFLLAYLMNWGSSIVPAPQRNRYVGRTITGSIFVVAAFMIIPLLVGVVAARKSPGTSGDFVVQGRAMGSVAVFFTVAATWWSAFAFLGSNATFYTSGPVYLTALAWNLLFGFMYYWVGKRVWFLGKRFNYLTPSDLMGDFYNSEALRILVVLITLVFTVPYLQIQLTGGAYLIEVASGGAIPFWLAALLFYFIIIVYVWIGGIRAIAWTDVIYGALLFFGMMYAGYYISQLVGGPAALFAQLQQSSPDHLTMPGPNGNMGYSMWFSLFVIVAIGAFMGPQIWLRMYSVKSGRLFNLMPFLLGLAAFAYFGSVLTGYTGRSEERRVGKECRSRWAPDQ